MFGKTGPVTHRNGRCTRDLTLAVLGTLLYTAPVWSTPVTGANAQRVVPTANSRPAPRPEGKPENVPWRSPASPTAVLPTYVPPADQAPLRTRGWTAGRRGCVVTAQAEGEAIEKAKGQDPEFTGQGLTPLAPLHHLGKTATAHPTFVWFGEHGEGVRAEFSLYAYDEARGTLAMVPVYQETRLGQPGFNALTLPARVAALQPGRTYAWQVVLQPECNANNLNPARNPWLRSAFQVVEPQPVQSVGQMAAQGLWYDALATAWQTRNEAQFAALLQQLAELEARQEPSEQPLAARLSQALRRIAAYPLPEVRAAIAP